MANGRTLEPIGKRGLYAANRIHSKAKREQIPVTTTSDFLDAGHAAVVVFFTGVAVKFKEFFTS
jgi:hypothetical protein